MTSEFVPYGRASYPWKEVVMRGDRESERVSGPPVPVQVEIEPIDSGVGSDIDPKPSSE